jgi:hypothetical protein
MPVTQSGADIWFLRLLLPLGNRHPIISLSTLIDVGQVSEADCHLNWELYAECKERSWGRVAVPVVVVLPVNLWHTHDLSFRLRAFLLLLRTLALQSPYIVGPLPF